MKTWKENLVHPVLGDFHIHTCYSDGTDTVDAYCQRAKDNGLTHIAFTEHVRRKLSYNFSDYVSEIIVARERYPELTIFAGCETKVIDRSGNLDIQKSVIDSCDLITAVFHSFPSQDKEIYLEALENMLANPIVDIWGHPTLFAKKHGFQLSVDEVECIIEACISSNVTVEINLKYDLPDQEFLEIACGMGAEFVFGSDAHAVDELLNKDQLVKQWKKIARMY